MLPNNTANFSVFFLAFTMLFFRFVEKFNSLLFSVFKKKKFMKIILEIKIHFWISILISKFIDKSLNTKA